MLESIPARAWQVIHTEGDIRILLEGAPESDDASLVQAMQSALTAAGGTARHVAVEHVDAIPKGAIGNGPLVRNVRR